MEGGFRVSGRWTFSSGCRHANWMAGFARVRSGGERADATPRLRVLLLPRAQVEVLDTWDVRGMRGTGSHHWRVEDLFVPDHRSVSLTDPLCEPGPLYRLPLNLMFACGFGSVALGIARSALDAAIELCADKTPAFRRKTLRDESHVQMDLGRAEALWRATRARPERRCGRASRRGPFSWGCVWREPTRSARRPTSSTSRTGSAEPPASLPTTPYTGTFKTFT